MKYWELETPCLLVDRERMLKNLKDMQEYANENNCSLRPHSKTHKSPYIAKFSVEIGAKGIAVAKTEEADVMVNNGIDDVFIANQIVDPVKLAKIKELNKKADVSFGLDNSEVVSVIEDTFKDSDKKAQVLIEIEVGEVRSGIIEEDKFLHLLEALKKAEHVYLKGLFSHDGNTYSAATVEECFRISAEAQKRTLYFAELARKNGFDCPVISYGATPTFMNHVPILKGITELRPGTYVYMDVSQGNACGTLERCAATVLTSVVSKPTDERVILDAGAKALTMQERTVGICNSKGKGNLYSDPEIRISRMFDEHAIINSTEFSRSVKIGDKIRIIPVHICPVVNLYDSFYLISGDEVIGEIPILCRGKIR